LALALAPLAARGAVVYSDGFDNGSIASNLQSVGGAALRESGGTLSVTISSPGQGLVINYPTGGINCLELTVNSIRSRFPLRPGDTLTWTWHAVDLASGIKYPLLESKWTHLGVLVAPLQAFQPQRQDPQQARTVFSTRKRDRSGNTVTVTQRYDPADLNMLPPAGKQLKQRWDRWTGAGGGEVVQCEIVIVDAAGMVCRYVKLFPAQDPPSFEPVSLTVTANFPVDLTLDGVVGDDLHQATVETTDTTEIPVDVVVPD
jgi:hypothetical protein